MKMKRVLYGLLMALFTSQAVFGAGFALYEGSARGNSLGGLTGHGDDAAAVYYNPAGITNLEGVHFMGGATFIIPFADLTTTDLYSGDQKTTSFEDAIFTPPHMYYTRQINDKLWFGAGVFTRFGLGVEFDSDWEGRYSSTNAQIQSLTFNANLAYKINDKVSIAAGVRGIWFDLLLEQAIDPSALLGLAPNDPSTNTLMSIRN